MLTPTAFRSLASIVALLLAAPTALLTTSTAAAAEELRPAKVRGWSVDLDQRALSAKGQHVPGRASFGMVGLTWTGGGDPGAHVRTRTRGVWSEWQHVDQLTHGNRAATEPLWVGSSQALQVRVETWREDLAVVMVDPGEEPESETTTATATGTVNRAPALTMLRAASEPDRAPMPRLRQRSAWGANESLRGSDPVYLNGIKQAHVHHTAGSSSYTRAEVPGIIRSMYWYHTQKLGWSDIGYNFLVDRFGRIWVGRAGGFRKRVKGAHTLGFNHSSFGVASIGNHEESGTHRRVRHALVRLIAWKLDKEGRSPLGYVRITSKGSDRYPTRTRVRLPVVTGHRDTNMTACPGASLYMALPKIRRGAQRRVDMFN
jgi:hypothetical protein